MANNHIDVEPGLPDSHVSSRIREIDLLRGLAIVLMALDHTRDYFHVAAFQYDPLDPDRTTALVYATRWITHLCAPIFVFLSGVSAFVQASRGRGRAARSWFLLSRGVWLVMLEISVLSFGWSFGAPFPLFLQVIWAIGWAMIALAGLVWLPRVSVLVIGAIIVIGHNLLDPIEPEMWGVFAPLWMVLHEGGNILDASGAPIALFAYPVLPWIGVMALGYGMGGLFVTRTPGANDFRLPMLGVSALIAFAVLRGFNLYGEPHAWVTQDTPAQSLMAFLNIAKYPPSLHFLLVTLGLSFILAFALGYLRGAPARVLSVFGAAPLFFYVLHVYFIHALSIAAHIAAGRDPAGLIGYLRNAFIAFEKFADVGFSLGWTYAAWVLVLLVLYWPTRWWAGVKSRHRAWWLSYL